MINEYNAKLYCCEDISKIENYEQAVADITQMWDIHHRAEITQNGVYSRQELISNGLYWKVPASELIFLTHGEHARLHMTGREVTEDTREKIGNSMSVALKGRKLSEEHKQKMRAALKGMHWFNNGEKSIMAFECPPGFVPGRLKNQACT